MLFAKSALASMVANDVEYDAQGHPMFLIKSKLEMEEMLNMIDSDATMMPIHHGFPEQFWTKYTADGEKEGFGGQEGFERVAMKAHTGKFVSMHDPNDLTIVANRDVLGPWEKFMVNWHGGNSISLSTDHQKFVSCNQGSNDDDKKGSN